MTVPVTWLVLLTSEGRDVSDCKYRAGNAGWRRRSAAHRPVGAAITPAPLPCAVLPVPHSAPSRVSAVGRPWSLWAWAALRWATVGGDGFRSCFFPACCAIAGSSGPSGPGSALYDAVSRSVRHIRAESARPLRQSRPGPLPLGATAGAQATPAAAHGHDTLSGQSTASVVTFQNQLFTATWTRLGSHW